MLDEVEVEVIEEEEEGRTGRMIDAAPELNKKVVGGLAVTVALAAEVEEVEEVVVIGISTPTNPMIDLFAFLCPPPPRTACMWPNPIAFPFPFPDRLALIFMSLPSRSESDSCSTPFS